MKVRVFKFFKWIFWIILFIIGLILLLTILIQLPFVQNKLKNFAINFLEDKIKTEVALDRIYINFPNEIELDGFLLKDQVNDTLVYSNSLRVSINLFDLLNSKANITNIDLNGFNANISRDINGNFNFDYIIAAFASTEEKKEEKESNFEISLNKISLDKIKLSFNDKLGGNDFKVGLHSFSTEISVFDLKKSIFKIPELYVDGLVVDAKRSFVAPIVNDISEVVDTSSVNPLQLVLGKIVLSNFDVSYLDDNINMDAKVKFKKLQTVITSLDLNKMNFQLESIDFIKSDIDLKLLKTDKVIKNESLVAQESTTNSPKFEVKDINLEDLKIKFSNLNNTKSNKGIDFNYLDFSKINLDADNLSYSSDLISGVINSAYLNEKSGLEVTDFETNFEYGPKTAFLKNLFLKTPNTEIKESITIKYSSISDLTNKLGDLELDANFKKSKVSFKDILILVPALSSQDIFKNNPNATLYLDTRVFAKVNHLQIPKFNFSGFNNTAVSASGTIKNVLNPDNLYLDLDVKNLASSKRDINSFLPKNTLPNNISLPQNLSVNGKIKGSLKQIVTNLKLNSSYGSANIVGEIDQRIKDSEHFDVYADLIDFDLGKLIKNDSVGKISANIGANGKSFNPKLIDANLKATVKKAVFNNYLYQDLNINGNVAKGIYNADVVFKDDNADVNLITSGSLLDEHPSLKLNGTIAKLDFYRMNLTQSPMALKGEILADFSDLHPDHLNGKMRLYNFAYADGKQVIPFDSIKVDAFSDLNSNSLKLQSQFLNLDAKGKYTITQLPQLLTQKIATYYNLSDSKTKFIDGKDTNLSLDVTIKNDKVLYQILPNLKSFDNATLHMNYVAQDDILNLNANFPNLVYGANKITSAIINVDTNASELQYKIGVAKLESESYLIERIGLFGDVSNNNINYLFNIKDAKDAEQYKIAGSLANIQNSTQISLDPQGLILNYQNWLVNQNNTIAISNAGISAQDFILENNDSQLKIQSENQKSNSPLNISFHNFKIEDLTNIIKKDSLLASGVINGSAKLLDLNTKLKFLGDITISDLKVMNSKVGNLNLKVTNTRREDAYSALITLNGNDNNLKVYGSYYPKTSNVNLTADVQALQMQTLQGFASNLISNPNGFLSGDLKINGSLDSPKILGDLKFNNIGLTVNTLNATFKDINETIAFKNDGIHFNQFSITDIENNNLVINGGILTNNYKDFNFRLRFRANNFKLMNSTEKDNQLFYGKMYVDLNMRINGDLNLPIVDGSIKVNQNTNFSFVLPSSDPSIADREGIVEFVDEDNLILEQTLVINEELGTSDLRGLNVNANISIDKEATLNIVIDKQNGDKLTVFGEAELTGGIDPSGKTSLTGTYEIDKGSYEMSFNFIKRKFEIKKGSSIIWTGTPTSATANITAIYKTNTSPIDLLDSQLQGMSETQRNLYKQRIEVDTYLMMEGELLKPEISFDIKIPEENYNASSEVTDATEEKLKQLRNDQAEMNKQVISLLVLNRFIGENPFASSTGSSVESMARQSVSKIISQQLNNLASEIVSGFELNFDLESSEDYSTGALQNRTDLNVELSKRLFNDRLKITIGSNFGLEGEERTNEQMTNIAGDISAEYMLTEDGRYIVRAYSKNRYQVAFQGQVVETGVGFIITMNYNQFKEILQRRRENREFRRDNPNFPNRNFQNRQPIQQKDSIQSTRIDTTKKASIYPNKIKELNNVSISKFYSIKEFLKPEEQTL